MSFPAGFYTKDFFKPTATERTFLHGKSHHPPAVFKSIVCGEAVRLRRLNECQIQYTKSLGRLQAKCLKLHFNMRMVDDMIQKAMTWTERFEPNSSNHNNKKRIVWAAAFKNILSFLEKVKALVPHATIVYKRPFSQNSMITNYKTIAITSGRENAITTQTSGESKPCGNCALCGNFGVHRKNMVKNTNTVTNPHGKISTLKQNLNCKNYGIYATRCLLCGQFCVGQTINRFSKRWAGHRASWIACGNSESKFTPTVDDSSALYAHLIKYHNTLRKATTLPGL